MLYRINEVLPGEGLTLHLTYTDGATIHADLSFLLERSEGPGVFAPLKDRHFFEQVQVGERGRSITWPGELDLDVDVFRVPDSSSEFPILSSRPALPSDPVSLALRGALAHSGLTQTELARRSGMAQPSVARLLDPTYHGHSLNSVRQVASALGLKVELRLIPAHLD